MSTATGRHRLVVDATTAGQYPARDDSDELHRVDRVVIATHVDEALLLLADPTEAEGRLLGTYRHSTYLVTLGPAGSAPQWRPPHRLASPIHDHEANSSAIRG